jgi:hypothetical protein
LKNGQAAKAAARLKPGDIKTRRAPASHPKSIVSGTFRIDQA